MSGESSLGGVRSGDLRAGWTWHKAESLCSASACGQVPVTLRGKARKGTRALSLLHVVGATEGFV